MRYLYVPGLPRFALAALCLSILVLPAMLQAQSIQVRLGEYGGTATIVKTESGRYTWNDQPVFDGSTITSADGSRYVLSFSGATWTAGYLPRLVRVPLGASGDAITLRELENGQFWWNGLVEDGLTFTAADGKAYRLSYVEGLWNATPVPGLLSVPLGQSGETAVLSPLATGGYTHDGRVVRSGLEVSDSRGRVYRFIRSGDSWRAVPVSTPRPPPGGTDPGPGPVVRSDFLDAYVGVRPVLKTGEDRTRRSVLEIGGAEYSVYELFSQEGVTWAPTFAERASERIESILDQIDVLAAAYDGDRTGLRSAIQTRWDRAEKALEGLFGNKADDVLGSLPLTRNRAVDLQEVVETLEEMQAALSSYREFYDAVVDGVFEDGDLDAASADDAFDAVQSVTKLKFGSTANTRFGAYLGYGRGPDGDGDWEDRLERLDGEDGFGAFAYSPLEASRRAELPNRGEADYVGRTIAVSTDGDLDTFAGTIEVNVRFASNRVSALVSDLRDESGKHWRYGFAEVDYINLPSASLDDDDASFEVTSRNATLTYRSLFGAPRPRDLRSDFKGTFVGEGSEAGDSVIGTWTLGGTRSVPLLSGAFGADFDSTPVSTRPVLDDIGEDSATYVGTQPDRGGNIRVGGEDEDGEDLSFSASDLFADGYAESVGPALVSVARDRIEHQLQLLDLWLELGDSESELNARRDGVWESANEALFVIVFGRDRDARDPLGSSYPRDGRRNRDDDDARSLLVEAANALGSVNRFEDALEEDGVFYEERAAVEDVDSMFEVLDHYVRVEYRYTDYGRFGVWSRTEGNSAAEGFDYDLADSSGAFAYSPLDQATYLAGHPGYPTDGSAYYEGSTVAVEESSDGPRIFDGRIALTVDWESSISRSNVSSVIHDLRTVDTRSIFRYNGHAVDQIVFSSGLRLSGGDEDGIEFDSLSPSVRIRYIDAARSDTRVSGHRSHAGKFVGTSRGGPLGVIGTWELGRSSRSDSVKGAYAADLVP